MEFKLKVFQNDEGIFAEVLNSDGKQVCIGDGESPYMALKDVCLVFANILDIAEEEENRQIASIIKERELTDDWVRYTSEDVKRMRFGDK